MDRPSALPFHSTQTLEEARNLVILYCPKGYDGNYRVQVDWDPDDLTGENVTAAVVSAKRQFRLE